MVKYLYFNASNFNQLILSGLLIEIYKDDIECHPSEQTHELKFIQGPNVVENTIDGILKFANADNCKKYFGVNAQQQGVINMVNGVCKDIDSKLISTQSAEDLTEKIEYLNEFWANPSYQWLKNRFYYCHMNILTLSFRVQEKFPDLLIKYPVFVELRRMFISDKWLSKRALVSMFANPCNAYQQFDLFPEAEGECSLRSSFGVPAQQVQQGLTVQQIDDNFVQIQAIEIPDGIEINEHKSHHQKQKITERFTQSEIEQPQNQGQSLITEKEFRNIDSDISMLTTENRSGFDNLEQSTRVETLVADIKIENDTEIHHKNQQQVRQQNKSEAFEVVGSSIPTQNSAIVGDLTSEIASNVQNLKVNDKIQDLQHLKIDETMNESSEINKKKRDSSDNDGSNKMKKSLKESFSQHFTRPLQYSNKSLTDENEKILKNQINESHPQNVQERVKQDHSNHFVTHQQIKRIHEQKKIQEKINEDGMQQEPKIGQTAIQLKKQVIIDEAQSEKYLSQQHFGHHQKNLHPDAHKVQTQQKIPPSESQQTEKKPANVQGQVNPQQPKLVTKVPQLESLASSQKGPIKNMNQQIKPRQQGFQRQNESCKCEIY